MKTKLENILDRVGDKRKFRNVPDELLKVLGRKVKCMICLKEFATKQFCVGYGSRCRDIVPVSWYWVCDKCISKIG